MVHIFFYGCRGGGGSVEVYNVFDLKECLIILKLYILSLLIIVSFSISVIFNMYVTKLCLVNVPCIILVLLLELAVMFCVGENRDILIIGL